MWIHDDDRHRGAGRAGRWTVAWLALLLIAPTLLAPAATAQEPAAETAAGTAAAEPAEARGEATAELRAAVEERYSVLPSRTGVMLVPETEIPGIRSIEVADGEVAINGEVVSPTILRSWLGDEAEPLLELAAVDTAAARDLLGVDEARAAAQEAAAEGSATETGDEAGEDASEAEPAEDEDGAAEPPEPPAPPAPPEPSAPTVRTGSLFKLGSDIVIEEDEVASEAVAIGGAVTVLGRVSRDVVAIGGPVEVQGEVGGEIVSVFGGVTLGPDAEVGRNVTSVGRGVRQAPGARVRGGVTEVAMPGSVSGEIDWDEWVRERRSDSPIRAWRMGEPYWNLIGIGFLALLACLAILAARGPVGRVEERVSDGSDLLVSGLVGVAAVLLVLAVVSVGSVLLAITGVGCLLLPFFWLAALVAVFLAAVVGYAGVALRVGRWTAARFGWRPGGPYVLALIGIALIEVWKLIGEILGIFTGPVWFFAAMFIFAGLVLEIVVWLVGFGAVIMNLFANRQRGGELPPGAGAPLPPGAPGSPAAGAATGAPRPTPPPAGGQAGAAGGAPPAERAQSGGDASGDVGPAGEGTPDPAAVPPPEPPVDVDAVGGAEPPVEPEGGRREPAESETRGGDGDEEPDDRPRS